jgi:hypothetical protein
MVNQLQFTNPQAYSGGVDFTPLERLGLLIKQQREEADAAEQVARLFGQSQQPNAAAAPPPSAVSPQAAPPRPVVPPSPLPPQVPRGLTRPLDPRAQEQPGPLTPNQRVAGGFNEFNPLTPQQRIAAGHEAVTLDPAQRVAGGFDALQRVIVDTPQAAAEPQTQALAAADPLAQPKAAISAIESGSPGGNYQELGPIIPKTGDRAYGRYQVMGANIPDWTEKHFGQRLTPQQFIANPAAQDAVFNGQFGEYARKYGPTKAAKAWFAGERGMNNPNARDPLGTTVSSYAEQFNRNMGLPSEITEGTSRPEGLPKSQAMAFDAAVSNLSQPRQPAAMSATGGISKEQIAALYRNPLTRPIATAYLQKALDPGKYDFMVAGENIIRYNKADGSYTQIPLTSKPQVVSEGGTLVSNTGQVLYGGGAQAGGKLPANFKWKDPDDKSKGVEPIAGGPGEQVAAEVAGRIGLAKNYLKNLPDIEQRIQAGEVGIDNPRNHAMAIAGVGAPGELRRKIDSGADALIRMLTGAGMNIGEASDYARRYRVTPRDTKDAMLSKTKALADELRSTASEVAKGHGGFKDPSQAPSAAPAGKPEVGKIYHGRPYLGGDPTNPKSWGPKQ